MKLKQSLILGSRFKNPNPNIRFARDSIKSTHPRNIVPPGEIPQPTHPNVSAVIFTLKIPVKVTLVSKMYLPPLIGTTPPNVEAQRVTKIKSFIVSMTTEENF